MLATFKASHPKWGAVKGEKAKSNLTPDHRVQIGDFADLWGKWEVIGNELHIRWDKYGGPEKLRTDDFGRTFQWLKPGDPLGFTFDNPLPLWWRAMFEVDLIVTCEHVDNAIKCSLLSGRVVIIDVPEDQEPYGPRLGPEVCKMVGRVGTQVCLMKIGEAQPIFWREHEEHPASPLNEGTSNIDPVSTSIRAPANRSQ